MRLNLDHCQMVALTIYNPCVTVKLCNKLQSQIGFEAGMDYNLLIGGTCEKEKCNGINTCTNFWWFLKSF
ncbi:hypothetical protein VNO77_13090 [Canavalia gladiata]|uniref:Uncharacterized protein n=1 Tax=Canavalia gladiata TaxID=3824 RepID=A0AAN9LXI6_CANGL